MRLTFGPGRKIPGLFAPTAPRFRQFSCIPDAPLYNRALTPGMCPETESGDRPEFSRFPEDPARLTVDLGRQILGPFASSAARCRRLAYTSDATLYNLALAPRIRAETKSGGRRHFSKRPGDSIWSNSDPGRKILGPFAPNGPRFRRISCIPDAPLYNLPHTPRICPETESVDLPDFSRFPEAPARMTRDPDRRIMGPFPPITARFRRLSYVPEAPLRNRAHTPCMCLEQNPPVAGISRNSMRPLRG